MTSFNGEILQDNSHRSVNVMESFRSKFGIIALLMHSYFWPTVYTNYNLKYIVCNLP
jgi:hypothetical protein